MRHYVTTAIRRGGAGGHGGAGGQWPRRLRPGPFSRWPGTTNILISQGSGGHGYVFAELAYYLRLAGYNVFIRPKHGGRTVDQLLTRHEAALETPHAGPAQRRRAGADVWA